MYKGIKGLGALEYKPRLIEACIDRWVMDLWSAKSSRQVGMSELWKLMNAPK